MPVGPHALTSLANVKSALRITVIDHDVELERRIDAVTNRFELFTHRKLKLRTYKPSGAVAGEENLLLNGDDRLSRKAFLFPHYPVKTMTALTIKDKDLADPQIVNVTKLVIDNTVPGRVVILEDTREWRLGTNNVEATWQAGLESLALAELEELCIKQVVQDFLDRDRGREGIQSISAAGESVTYLSRNLLQDVLDGLLRFKRVRFA